MLNGERSAVDDRIPSAALKSLFNRQSNLWNKSQRRPHRREQESGTFRLNVAV